MAYSLILERLLIVTVKRSRVGLQFAEVELRLTPFGRQLNEANMLIFIIIFQFIDGLAK